MLITRFDEIPEGKITIYYGGSFNPPHVSHVLFVMMLRALFSSARIIVAPTYSHAFNKSLLPYDLRVRMLESVLGDVPGVEVSLIERELHASTSYTIDVVKALREDPSNGHILVAVGADIVPTLPQWRSYEELDSICSFLVFPRVGYSAPCLPVPALPEVSSTAIREALMRYDEDDRIYLRAYLPEKVVSLYRAFVEQGGSVSV